MKAIIEVAKRGAAIGSAKQQLADCADCKSQFTVTVGTVFERSKVPLHKWVGLNDTERAEVALKNIGGKRLTYRPINRGKSDTRRCLSG